MADGKQFAVLDNGRIGLGRSFKFEAGHTLAGYDGKCATPHGHSYFGSVRVSVPRAVADTNGILLDFDLLKKAISDCIERPYDHRSLTCSAEELVFQIAKALQAWFQINGGQTINVPHEDMGLRTRTVPLGVEVERVVLHETANCFVEWKRRGY